MLTFLLDADVVVKNGAGAALLWPAVDAPPKGFVAGLGADVLSVAVKAPSDDAEYGWVVFDADKFGVVGQSGIVGNAVASVTGFIYPRATIEVLGASVDGLYKVRIYARQTKSS